jgi:hypothetical protein
MTRSSAFTGVDTLAQSPFSHVSAPKAATLGQSSVSAHATARHWGAAGASFELGSQTARSLPDRVKTGAPAS